MDSLREVFNHKYNIDARLESRYSFINHELTRVSGLRLGLAFQRKLRLGGGLSWLKSDLKNNSFGQSETTLKHLKFIYFCLYADFVFYKTKRWQLSVPIQVGLGYSWLQKRKDYYFGNKDPKYFLFLYEPGITAQFKIFKWFGVGSDVAYRFSFNNKKTLASFNSPTYSFKILIWFDQLFYDLLPNSEISKKYGPAYW